MLPGDQCITQLAKMSIDPDSVELTAYVIRISYKISSNSTAISVAAKT